MRKLHSLAAGLLFATAALAQTGVTPVGPVAPVAPCSTFEPPSPAGNWVLTAASATYGDVMNTLDGSNTAHLYDNSGGSWYENTVDYVDLGKRFLHQCLCFDYFLIDDGGSGVPFYPTIYLNDGVNTIGFVSSTAVTPGSGWIHVCAPIEHCSGGVLPSNADGAWQVITGTGGSPCADFDNILDHVVGVSFPTDINSCPCEEMAIDNVCVKQCGDSSPCHADFKLITVFNTATGTADADVGILTPWPGSNYWVDWGDGSPAVPVGSGPHNYATPGAYNVCVTEYDEQKRVICRVCMTFCYRPATTEIGGGGTNPDHPQGRASAPSLNNQNSALRFKNDHKFDNEGYAIFPNPSKDYADVQLSLSKTTKVTVRIIDIYGKVVVENTSNLERGTQKIRMNTEKLTNGIYNVEINEGGKITSQKLSVSK